MHKQVIGHGWWEKKPTSDIWRPGSTLPLHPLPHGATRRSSSACTPTNRRRILWTCAWHTTSPLPSCRAVSFGNGIRTAKRPLENRFGRGNNFANIWRPKTINESRWRPCHFRDGIPFSILLEIVQSSCNTVLPYQRMTHT